MKIFNKKNLIQLSIIAVASFVTLLSSCKKEEAAPTGTGTISVEFDNVANGNTLKLNTDYTNANGDVMNFAMFNYYVSNFSLVKSDGTIYTVPKDSCYFLIKEDGGTGNPEIELNNIPAGDYKEIRFMIGVDSAKSVSPAAERTGVLDPAGDGAGMYWAWNSGYIFVKAEGTSPQAPLDPASNTNKFRYHIGLFGGLTSKTVNNLKSVELHDHDGEVATVRTNISPNFHVKVDIMEMFKTPNTISVAANPTVMVTPFSENVANNYKDMFSLDHIHN